MADTYFFSPYSNPANSAAKLISLDPTNTSTIALTSASVSSGVRALKPDNTTFTSIVDEKSEIKAGDNGKVTYIKISGGASISFETKKVANITIVFCPNATSGSLDLMQGENQIASTAASNTKCTVQQLQANNLSAGTYTIKAVSKEMDILEIVLVELATQDDATLKAIKIGDAELKGFDAATTEYNVELPYGTTTAPEVSATATSDKANVAITPATSATGTATITVTAEDGTTTKTYTIHFTVSTSVSTDATLKSLSIDGNAVAGFRADSLDYKYEIAYTAALPVISAEVNDAAATMVITQAEAAPGTATVVVTAQDGTTTTTYTVAISRAAAIKHLTAVPFSNGAKGAIDESALTVTVPYLAGTEEPTIDATGITVSGDGASAALIEDGKTITLTGADGTSAEYTIVLQPLAAQEFGTEEITFDGQETYIYGAYGWDASKGWKFSKNVDEEGNMRNAKGNTRIYMALSPAESVNLISSPNVSSARKINVYVNGVLFEKETPKNGGVITLTLTTEANNFIIIESNQTGGDGGFTAMQLTNPKTPTSFEQAEVSAKAVKVVRDGQLYILRDGKTYNAQGIIVE